MTIRRIKASKASIETREELEQCVGLICSLTIDRNRAMAEMDAKIKAIRDIYEQELSSIAVQLDIEMAEAQAWAQNNPDEFAGRKSMELVHGTLGFRTGTPKLKTLKGWTWERVLSALRSAGIGVDHDRKLRQCRRDGRWRPLCRLPANHRAVHRRCQQALWHQISLACRCARFGQGREMCRLYLLHWCGFVERCGPQDAARIWNGGPTGYRETATIKYWKKVKPVYGKLCSGRRK